MTLRIHKSMRAGIVVFALSGRIEGEQVEELERLFRSENGRKMILNLKDITLVDQAGVGFLGHCENDGCELMNCPAYIREWIALDRNQGSPQQDSSD